MAFRTQKISQMTPKGADLEATDLIEVSTIESGSYVTRSITGQELIDAIPLPPTGLTVGTTPIASGTIGRVLFQGTGNVLQQSSSLAYDDTTKAFSVIGNQNATTNISVVNTDTTNASSRARVSVTSGTIIGSMTSIIGNDFYLGTESAHNVNFTTAGTTRFNLNNSTGNLNIGTLASDIGARLGVRGSGSTSATKTLLVRNLANTDLLTIWDDGAIGVNTSTNAGFRLDVNGTARVQDNLLLTNGIIATSTATTRLQGSLNYFTHNRIGSSGTLGFQIAQTNTLSSFWRWSDATDNVEFGNARNAPLCLFTNNTERLRIFGNGNVGINTTTDAGFRLDVNGTARVSGNTNGVITTITNGAATNNVTALIRQTATGGSGDAKPIGLQIDIQGATDNDNILYGRSWNSGTPIERCYISRGGNMFLSGSVGIGVSLTAGVYSSLMNINASARLQVDSTTQGFLPPRMTTTQKNAIASPAAGLVVYDTTLAKLCVYTTTWETITSL